jgi:aminomethyltransferase
MGYALYGNDIDREHDPLSAGLGWTVALAKGDFIGRDKLVRIKSEGITRKLVGLVADEGAPRHGYPVLHDGAEVGTVASGSFAPTLSRGIATAYLPVELASPGTAMEISIRRKTVRAEVVKMPFVKGTSLTPK